MTVRMENLERLTLSEMEELLASNRGVKIEAADANTGYGLIERVLRWQGYRRLKKSEEGTIRRFLMKVSGFSRAQITRLIRDWLQTRRLKKRKPGPRPRFVTRYTREDVLLLAAVDEAHQDLSGPAVRHLLKWGWKVYGDPAYARLAGISASHNYNLRHSLAYQRVRVRVEHTQARQVSIGERRRPDPRGQPGHLRVDTVHQGHHDGKPGLYHLNAVDTVTQWEILGCVETISERHMKPVLEAMLHQFPFRIRGFHCDNGSEFLNRTVAKLLNKLLIEFTKSRVYRTTDNAQVEGKNGAVVRKLIGYGPIGAQHAEEFQKFYAAQLNPYLNFHRPCGFATIQTDPRGKRRRIYRHRDYQTPYEKLRSLADWQGYLKPGVTEEHLERQAQRLSDTAAARQMRTAQCALLSRCRQTNGSQCAAVKKRCGNAGQWTPVQNPGLALWRVVLDTEFRTVAHYPWKSPTARFPHSHSAGGLYLSLITHGSPFGRPTDYWTTTKGGMTPAEETAKRDSFSGSCCTGNEHLVQAHLALESNSDFRLISGLENAPGASR